MRVITTDGAIVDVPERVVHQSEVLAGINSEDVDSSEPFPVPMTAAVWDSVWATREPAFLGALRADPTAWQRPSPEKSAFADVLNAANFLAADGVLDGLLRGLTSRLERRVSYEDSARQFVAADGNHPGHQCKAAAAYYAGEGSAPVGHGLGPDTTETHGPVSQGGYLGGCRTIIRLDESWEACTELELVLSNPENLPIERCFESVSLLVGGLEWDEVPSWALRCVAALHGRPQPTVEQDATVVPVPLLGTHRSDALPRCSYGAAAIKVRGLARSTRLLSVRGRRFHDLAGQRYASPGRPLFGQLSHGVTSVEAELGSGEVRLDLDHPARAVIVGGLDPDRVRSIRLVLNGHTLRGELHESMRHVVRTALEGVDEAVVDEVLSKMERLPDLVGDAFVLRLSDAPMDDSDPGPLVNLSRVSSQILAIDADLPAETVVRVAVIHTNIIRYMEGYAGMAYARV